MMCLTPREREMLGAVAEGKAHKEIAAEKGISLSTVKNHMSNIRDTLGAISSTHAVATAIRGGIIN